MAGSGTPSWSGTPLELGPNTLLVLQSHEDDGLLVQLQAEHWAQGTRKVWDVWKTNVLLWI